uniref:Uncharacterized protein n=1 Tax=Anopheles culicifacies TaxID=139723 RepID=A0A182MPI3_9DIPT
MQHGMIRCPYIHEMHERLLGPTPRRPLPITFPPLAKPEVMDRESDCLLDSRPESRQIVGTVVKLNPDGFGAHTTSTHHHHHHGQQQPPLHHRTPLVPCNGTDDDEERAGGHHPLRDGAGTITSTISDSDDDGIHLRTHLRKIIEGRKPKNAKDFRIALPVAMRRVTPSFTSLQSSAEQERPYDARSSRSAYTLNSEKNLCATRRLVLVL